MEPSKNFQPRHTKRIKDILKQSQVLNCHNAHCFSLSGLTHFQQPRTQLFLKPLILLDPYMSYWLFQGQVPLSILFVYCLHSQQISCGLVTAARGFLILSVVTSSLGLSALLSGRMGREPSPFLVLGMWAPIQGSRTRQLKKIPLLQLPLTFLLPTGKTFIRFSLGLAKSERTALSHSRVTCASGQYEECNQLLKLEMPETWHLH